MSQVFSLKGCEHILCKSISLVEPVPYQPSCCLNLVDFGTCGNCLTKLLGITYRDHISNEEVQNRTRQAIGPHEDLLTTVKQRKLRWNGHITRSSGLAKTILQGTLQGGRRRGRQTKRWWDNIVEWTGMTLGTAMRKAERREELVARSSVVPQRSTRLRDR